MIIFERKISKKGSYEISDYKDGNIIPMVSNTMFEVMFNNSGIRRKYTSYLLSLLFDKDYEYFYNNIVFVKDTLDKEKYCQKGMTVDLICNIDGKYYNIELNNNGTKIERMDRNVAYLNSIYSGTLKTGDNYNYNYTIQVNLNNFVFDGVDDVKQEFMLRDLKGNILTDKIKIIQIYIPLIREKWYDKDELTELEKFMIITNEKDSSNVDDILKENKFMESYRDDAKEKSIDTEVVGLFNKEIEDGILLKASLKNEHEKGRKEREIEIVNNMIKQKIDIDTISKFTNLSKEEIIAIMNK